jgi:hemerythrin
MNVGLPEIDAEHKHFITLANEFICDITTPMELHEIRNCLLPVLNGAGQHVAANKGCSCDVFAIMYETCGV